MYHAPGTTYHYHSEAQSKHLSVAREAFNVGKRSCADECVDYDPYQHPPMRAFPPTNAANGLWRKEEGLLPNGFLKLSVRLVDLCAKLMAGEHTCLHSDHSLGRCLVFGAQAVPVGMACIRKYEKATTSIMPSNVSVSTLDVKSRQGSSYVEILHADQLPVYLRHSGMCFMLKHCDLQEHLTCHRFKAAYRNHRGLTPEKVYRFRSYYVEPSSCEVMEIGGPPIPKRWCDQKP